MATSSSRRCDTARLVTRQSGRILEVRFNNPPHHFYDEATSVELDDLTRSLQRDKSVGAVVFTGQGTAFTHLDVADLVRGSQLTPFGIAERPSRVVASAASLLARNKSVDRFLRHTPARDLLMLPRTAAALTRMSRMDKVFIAAINGDALAFGCVFALACDVRLMVEGDHVVGLPEIDCATLAGAGGTQRLVRAVGASHAAEMLLDARLLSPAEALGIGLVHRVVPAGILNEYAHEVAVRAAGRSALVNRLIKRSVYDAGSRSLRVGLRMEAASMIAGVTAPGASNAIRRLHDCLRLRDEDDTATTIRSAWKDLAGSH